MLLRKGSDYLLIAIEFHSSPTGKSLYIESKRKNLNHHLLLEVK